MQVKIFNNKKMWYYRIKQTDEKFELQTFLNKFNFSKEQFAELNPTITKLHPGTVLLMPPSSQYCHIVAPLENYQSIASMYNCSPEYLKQLNGTKKLFIGQKIFI